MKRIWAIVLILVLILAGCRRVPAQTTAPTENGGIIPVPQITLPEATGSGGLSDWTVEGDPPEGDFQIPPRPTDNIITQ